MAVCGRGLETRSRCGRGRLVLHFVGRVSVGHVATVGFLGAFVIFEGFFDGEGGLAFAFVVFGEVFLRGQWLVLVGWWTEYHLDVK